MSGPGGSAAQGPQDAQCEMSARLRRFEIFNKAERVKRKIPTPFPLKNQPNKSDDRCAMPVVVGLRFSLLV